MRPEKTLRRVQLTFVNSSTKGLLHTTKHIRTCLKYRMFQKCFNILTVILQFNKHISKYQLVVAAPTCNLRRSIATFVPHSRSKYNDIEQRTNTEFCFKLGRTFTETFLRY